MSEGDDDNSDDKTRGVSRRIVRPSPAAEVPNRATAIPPADQHARSAGPARVPDAVERPPIPRPNWPPSRPGPSDSSPHSSAQEDGEDEMRTRGVRRLLPKGPPTQAARPVEARQPARPVSPAPNLPLSGRPGMDGRGMSQGVPESHQGFPSEAEGFEQVPPPIGFQSTNPRNVPLSGGRTQPAQRPVPDRSTGSSEEYLEFHFDKTRGVQPIPPSPSPNVGSAPQTPGFEDRPPPQAHHPIGPAQRVAPLVQPPREPRLDPPRKASEKLLPPPVRPLPVENDPFGTRMIGDDLDADSSRQLEIQYYNAKRKYWTNLEPLYPTGNVIGRGSFRTTGPYADFLAHEHVRIWCEGEALFASEGSTINGAYLNVSPDRPVPLRSGSRFQIGLHVIEFVQIDPVQAPSIEPLTSDTGEVFRCAAMVPLAALDFLGPDGNPSHRFPLTKPEGTVLGREAEKCDIVLLGDGQASRRHARIFRRDDQFWLEDLTSSNGTFLRLTGPTPLRSGSPKMPALLDVLRIGDVLIRVVEL